MLHFKECKVVWPGDGLDLYLTTLSMPRERGIVAAGVWGKEVLMFLFHEIGEFLLVGGPGWTQRWWVTTADLKESFKKLAYLREIPGRL